MGQFKKTKSHPNNSFGWLLLFSQIISQSKLLAISQFS
ncbi:hypothetical protein AO379_1126 [Moraxella catarrhalis]|nr:hypothetical protein AO379_1126 [Moraxella catarrhalis]